MKGTSTAKRLHAKVITCGTTAWIGSANTSVPKPSAHPAATGPLQGRAPSQRRACTEPSIPGTSAVPDHCGRVDVTTDHVTGMNAGLHVGEIDADPAFVFWE